MSDAPPWTHVATRSSEARPRLPIGVVDGSATVHSAYRSAFNISTPAGLLTIASEAVGGLPNGIVADLGPDFRALGIRPGLAVEAVDRTLRIPGIDLRLDLAPAVAWSPRIRSTGDDAALARARWRRRRAATWVAARRFARAGGVAGLLGSGWALDHGMGLDVSERARPILAAVADALADGDRPAAAASARGLIGLGPGLTPSGDDALVGIEAGLHALGRPTAGFLAGALDDIDERTTTVAATLLRHAARGEFAERIHRLLAELLGSDDVAIPGAIERAVAWGATSGADCLVGVLCGLDVAAGPAGRSD